jgi:hypothetical protein
VPVELLSAAAVVSVTVVESSVGGSIVVETSATVVDVLPLSLSALWAPAVVEPVEVSPPSLDPLGLGAGSSAHPEVQMARPIAAANVVVQRDEDLRRSKLREVSKADTVTTMRPDWLRLVRSTLVILATGCGGDDGGSSETEPASGSESGTTQSVDADPSVGPATTPGESSDTSTPPADSSDSGASTGTAADDTAGSTGGSADSSSGSAACEGMTFFATSAGSGALGGNLGGLAGADAICQTAAENVGFGYKTWRAFLSVTDDGSGSAVDAIDRIGSGPWYDRNGRLIAEDLAGLLNVRPDGDAQTVNDLPDENGLPLTTLGDSHDVLTGSGPDGRLDRDDPTSTCDDWTAAVGPGFEEEVRCGHSWPAMSGQHWIAAHRVRGCAPGVNLMQNGPGEGDCVGCGGGWGGIYCFALEP